jgi:hypothetical protein
MGKREEGKSEIGRITRLFLGDENGNLGEEVSNESLFDLVDGSSDIIFTKDTGLPKSRNVFPSGQECLGGSDEIPNSYRISSEYPGIQIVGMPAGIIMNVHCGQYLLNTDGLPSDGGFIFEHYGDPTFNNRGFTEASVRFADLGLYNMPGAQYTVISALDPEYGEADGGFPGGQAYNRTREGFKLRWTSLVPPIELKRPVDIILIDDRFSCRDRAWSADDSLDTGRFLIVRASDFIKRYYARENALLEWYMSFPAYPGIGEIGPAADPESLFYVFSGYPSGGPWPYDPCTIIEILEVLIRVVDATPTFEDPYNYPDNMGNTGCAEILTNAVVQDPVSCECCDAPPGP